MKNATTKGTFRKSLAAAALCAAMLLLAQSACKAAATGQGANTTDEYLRIETAYAQVAMYYNKALSDGEARYIAKCILYYSNYYQLDPRLVVALIVAESRFKPGARSPKGAQGLGQLMPGTARYLGVSDAYDVQQNIMGSTRYMKEQFDRWQGYPDQIARMLASYNAGPNAVAKYNGIPPYSETRRYVAKITSLYRFFVNGR